ncbi:MAG TPA: hypothetical protein ENJ55_03665 [Rhizobiales bacterium]|nr:hypothetical protein [Hyphomicrobiales bacterium]
MTRRILCLLLIFVFQSAGPAHAVERWYKCIVHASSHTGYYTFRINQPSCAVYWKEIDTQLKIKSCKLPVIEALKPSATDNLSIVWFNMKTGQFYDYLSGVLDRGRCKVIDRP